MVRDQLSHADQVTIDAYMDAVAVHADLAGDQPIGQSSPARDIRTAVAHKRFPSRLWAWSAPVALAAAAAFVFVVKSRNESSAFAPASYSFGPIAQLSENATTVWGVERGAVMTTAEKKASARIGALLADFEATSGEDAKTVARSLVAALGALSGGQIVSAPYLQFATSEGPRMDDATRRENRNRSNATGRQSLRGCRRIFRIVSVGDDRSLGSVRYAASAGTNFRATARR